MKLQDAGNPNSCCEELVLPVVDVVGCSKTSRRFRFPFMKVIGPCWIDMTTIFGTRSKLAN